ncbi:MAG: hypothetical protein K2Y35_12860 [Burkholderiales bacterium]|nr:hypothetical protein [Burkholderiales bacterium]
MENTTAGSSDEATPPSSGSVANRLLGASALGLLGAGAGGLIAYEQADPFVEFVALTLAFASVLTSITLAALALGSVELAPDSSGRAPSRDTEAAPAEPERRWNGTGSPRSSGGHLRT